MATRRSSTDAEWKERLKLLEESTDLSAMTRQLGVMMFSINRSTRYRHDALKAVIKLLAGLHETSDFLVTLIFTSTRKQLQSLLPEGPELYASSSTASARSKWAADFATACMDQLLWSETIQILESSKNLAEVVFISHTLRNHVKDNDTVRKIEVLRVVRSLMSTSYQKFLPSNLSDDTRSYFINSFLPSDPPLYSNDEPREVRKAWASDFRKGLKETIESLSEESEEPIEVHQAPSSSSSNNLRLSDIGEEPDLLSTSQREEESGSISRPVSTVATEFDGEWPHAIESLQNSESLSDAVYWLRQLKRLAGISPARMARILDELVALSVINIRLHPIVSDDERAVLNEVVPDGHQIYPDDAHHEVRSRWLQKYGEAAKERRKLFVDNGVSSIRSPSEAKELEEQKYPLPQRRGIHAPLAPLDEPHRSKPFGGAASAFHSVSADLLNVPDSALDDRIFPDINRDNASPSPFGRNEDEAHPAFLHRASGTDGFAQRPVSHKPSRFSANLPLSRAPFTKLSTVPAHERAYPFLPPIHAKLVAQPSSKHSSSFEIEEITDEDENENARERVVSSTPAADTIASAIAAASNPRSIRQLTDRAMSSTPAALSGASPISLVNSPVLSPDIHPRSASTATAAAAAAAAFVLPPAANPKQNNAAQFTRSLMNAASAVTSLAVGAGSFAGSIVRHGAQLAADGLSLAQQAGNLLTQTHTSKPPLYPPSSSQQQQEPASATDADDEEQVPPSSYNSQLTWLVIIATA